MGNTLSLRDPRFDGGMIVATPKLYWAMRTLTPSREGILCEVCRRPVCMFYLDFTPDAQVGTTYCIKCWPGCVAKFRAQGAVCDMAEEFLAKTEEYLVNVELAGEPSL